MTVWYFHKVAVDVLERAFYDLVDPLEKLFAIMAGLHAPIAFDFFGYAEQILTAFVKVNGKHQPQTPKLGSPQNSEKIVR